MTLAERIYRLLLWLYPAAHRDAYGEYMLQHARDIDIEANGNGYWYGGLFYLRLIADGLFNASKEHWSDLTSRGTIEPATWIVAILAIIPGLLLAFTRRQSELLSTATTVLAVGYIALLLIGVPLLWWRRRKFPVWALLPAGIIVRWLILIIGLELATPSRPGAFLNSQWETIAIINLSIATILFTIALQGRLRAIAWLSFGLLLISILIPFSLYISDSSWLTRYRASEVVYGVSEMVLLLSLGLLAARRHQIFALLVVLGGYSHMVMDSAYLWPSPNREWSGISIYLIAITFIFLAVTPFFFMRTRTRIGRIVGLFVPVLIFLIGRLVIPSHILGTQLLTPYGFWLSMKVLLSLVVGWFLYRRIGGNFINEETVKSLTKETGITR